MASVLLKSGSFRGFFIFNLDPARLGKKAGGVALFGYPSMND